jgi:hypothetical protein
MINFGAAHSHVDGLGKVSSRRLFDYLEKYALQSIVRKIFLKVHHTLLVLRGYLLQKIHEGIVVRLLVVSDALGSLHELLDVLELRVASV